MSRLVRVMALKAGGGHVYIVLDLKRLSKFQKIEKEQKKTSKKQLSALTAIYSCLDSFGCLNYKATKKISFIDRIYLGFTCSEKQPVTFDQFSGQMNWCSRHGLVITRLIVGIIYSPILCIFSLLLFWEDNTPGSRALMALNYSHCVVIGSETA